VIRAIVRRLFPAVRPGTASPRAFWTSHNVTGHHRFESAQDSLEYFHWRNSQYPGYIELMPVAGFDGQRVLDFGCGPGHDVVGFATYSTCDRLVGVDVSPVSVAEARARLALHGADAEIIEVQPGAPLPFETGAFDHVHSSGVLHHVADRLGALKELHRVLKPSGTANLMVYNFNSLWMHLKVAYQRTLIEGRCAGASIEEQFQRSTDGEDCPISVCFRPSEFITLAREAGFSAVFAGAAVSLIELDLLPLRFQALMDRRLPPASRVFLEGLSFDDRMMPLAGGHRAGIAAVFHLRPAPPSTHY
jgi:ubiquinone/menaquinone biosynthesis C-methylase UbiE